jgi:hypothetical protein
MRKGLHAPKPRKPINKVGKVTKKWILYKHDWIERHGGVDGKWICYLQISVLCPQLLTVQTLTLDHVIPRSRRPDLRYNDDNIKPACWDCNSEKGSRVL